MTTLQRQKVVDIAQDLLNGELRKINLETGTYFETKDNLCIEGKNLTLSINKIFDENKGKVCYACAKGALFIGWIRKFKPRLSNPAFNKQSNELEGHFITDSLKNIFGLRNLALIETAFEGYECGTEDVTFIQEGSTNHKKKDTVLLSELDAAENFGMYTKTSLDESKRLKLILKNVIKNNGEFFPLQEKTKFRKKLSSVYSDV